MTRYQKELARMVAGKYGRLDTIGLVGELCRMGVVDHSLCRILAVRSWVGEAMKRGEGKVAAMWRAADHFCATYEYVRNCMYYHKDINI